MDTKTELKLFRDVNSVNRRWQVQNKNVWRTAEEKKVIQNQGVSRANLRKYIEDNKLQFDYWYTTREEAK